MWRIELDATADQQVKIANIAKAAIGDLRPLREKAQDSSVSDAAICIVLSNVEPPSSK